MAANVLPQEAKAVIPSVKTVIPSVNTVIPSVKTVIPSAARDLAVDWQDPSLMLGMTV